MIGGVVFLSEVGLRLTLEVYIVSVNQSFLIVLGVNLVRVYKIGYILAERVILVSRGVCLCALGIPLGLAALDLDAMHAFSVEVAWTCRQYFGEQLYLVEVLLHRVHQWLVLVGQVYCVLKLSLLLKR